MIRIGQQLHILLKKIASTGDRDPSKYSPNPYHDWVVLLALFSLCTLTAIGLGIYEFMDVSMIGAQSVSKTSDHATMIDEHTIDTLNAFYAERKNTLTALEEKRPQGPSDPSL